MPPTMSYPWLWETRTCRISNGILVCPRSSSISDSNRYLACRMDGTPAPHRVHVPLVVLLPFMDIAYTFGCQYLMVDHLVPFSCKLQKHDINYYSALFFDKKLLFRLSLYCQLLNKQVQDVCPSENHLGLSPPYLTCISCRHVTFCRRAPRPSFAYLVPHVSAPTSDEQKNSLHIRDTDYSERTTPASSLVTRGREQPLLPLPDRPRLPTHTRQTRGGEHAD